MAPPPAASDVPAGPPPPGHTSNFDDPASIANGFLLPNLIFMALAIVAVMLRMYTRVYLLNSWGSDDWLILIALVFSLSCSVLAVFMVRHGVGKHIWDVRLTEFSPTFLKYYLADVLTWNIAILFTKLSILLLYRRIFPVNSKFFTGLWWATFCVTVGYLVSGFTASLFACSPIAMAWDVTITDGHCINRTALYIATTSFGMLTDIALLIAPVIVLWNLALSRKQKIVVFLLLSMGSFTVFVGIYRLPVLVHFLNEGSSDITYTLVPTATWSLIEVNSAIVCACAVTLKPLVNRYMNNLLPSTEHNSNPRAYSYRYDGEGGRPSFRSHRTRRSEHRQRGSRPDELPMAVEGVKPSRQSRPIRLDNESQVSAEMTDVEMGMHDGQKGEGCYAVDVGELREKEDHSEDKSISGHSSTSRSSTT